MCASESPRSQATGFSLVELLVALVFTGILMAGMSKIFTASISNFATSAETIGIQRTARFGLLQLQEDILQAGYLLPPRIVTELLGNPQPPLKIETLTTDLIYKTVDGTSITLVKPDELQIVMDLPLNLHGTLKTTVDPAAGATNEMTVIIPSGGADLKVGDLAFVQDSAWEIFKIIDISASGNTYKLTFADNATLIDAFGNDTKASLVSPFITKKHIGTDTGTAPGAQVTFVRPLQVVSYTIQAMSLDPGNNAATVPCLIRRTKSLASGAFGTSEIIVEGVTGFQVDWSLDGGKGWIRKDNDLTTAQWGAIKAATNSKLAAMSPGSPLTKLLVGGMDSPVDPFWFNYSPLVIKMDLETRSRLQRSEYSNTSGTADYRTRRETLLVSSRNFALGKN